MQVTQPTLFSEPLNHVVNVASVPQLSPFRYPGGKTWLIPRIREWLRSRPPRILIEPFAGGAIVGLTAAAERLAERVVLVELDEQVAAVWDCIFTDNDSEWLAERIVTFDLTPGNLYECLSIPPTDNRTMAFQTMLKNRTYHGGIIAPGSGVLKYGENGKGLHSRWYPETLRRRILALGQLRDRIKVVHGDAFATIKKYRENPKAAFFVDPPYTAGGKKAGRRLYNYFELDHERLFHELASVRGDLLITYDDADGVKAMAEANGLNYRLIAMKNTHHANMSELLIGRDLSWIQ